MPKTTSIEVRCECNIPFHAELVACFQRLLTDPLTEDQLTYQLPHWLAIRQALHSKMLFIKVGSVGKVREWRPKLLLAAKRLLGKDFVGSIRADNNGITIILV